MNRLQAFTLCLGGCLFLLAEGAPPNALAQRSSAAGGIVISPEGHAGLAASVLEFSRTPPDGSSSFVWISLRRLERHIAALGIHRLDELPDGVRQLCGLDRVRLVVLRPDEQDIWLGGPVTRPGSPDMLEHLVIALRHIQVLGPVPVSCSIDPTAEGLAAVERLIGGGTLVARDAERLRVALGPQTVTIDGVADSSLAGRVLLAADLRMKSLALNLDPRSRPPIASYLATAPMSRAAATPRFWLHCSGAHVSRSGDGGVWQIGNVVVAASGESGGAEGPPPGPNGDTPPAAASRWAERFTAQYPAIRERYAEFQQLERMANLWITAAVIHARMPGGGAAPLAGMEPAPYREVKWVGPHVGRVRRGRHWIVGVSGGVRLDPGSTERTSDDPMIHWPGDPDFGEHGWSGPARRHSASLDTSFDGPRYFGLPVSSRRVTLLIDRSESMRARAGTTTRLGLAQRELVNLISAVPGGTSLRIIAFDRRLTEWSGPQPFSSLVARRSAAEFVLALTPREGTALFDALAAALAADTESESDAVYLLSDGHPTHGRLVDPRQIIAATTALNTRGIPIHTIGLGARGTGAALLRALAESTGGSCVIR